MSFRPFMNSDQYSFQILLYQMDISKFFGQIRVTTVELWSLELACLKHHGSLELIYQSWQIPYIFNVKIHPRVEQRWLELSYSKHGPQGNF